MPKHSLNGPAYDGNGNDLQQYGPRSAHETRTRRAQVAESRPAISRAEYGRNVAQGYEPITSAKEFNLDGVEHPKRQHTIGKVVLVLVLVLVAVLGTSAVLVYRSAKTVKADAQTVMDSVGALKDAVKSGDADAVASTNSTVNSAAHSIQNEVSGPAWTVLSFVPYFGQDFRTVRTLSNALVDVADNALGPIATNADSLKISNLVSNGTINVDAVKQFTDVFSQVSPTIKKDLDIIANVPDGRIPQVASAITKVKDNVSGTSEKLEKVNAILPYLPAMVGSDGSTKTYLVIAQNNAELRATGGFPGAWVPLTMKDGKISLGDSMTLQHYQIAYDWSDEEMKTFGLNNKKQNAENATQTPAFDRAGKFMAQAYQSETGTAPNGVIAVDPVFLQRLLALTGSVAASDGTEVTGDNAAQVLESDIYWKYAYNIDMQDALFSEVAGLAFNSLMSNLGKVDAGQLLKTITSSADEHRVQVWMADKDQENAVKQLDMAGELSQDETKPVLGVYVNDNTWAKIDWYLDMRTAVGDKVANADGSSFYKVTTTWKNTITQEQASSAPDYVSGINPKKKSRDEMILRPRLVAPAGGKITDFKVDGYDFAETTLYGLDCWGATIRLGSGETVKATYTVTTSPKATSDLTVRSTALGQSFK